MDISKNVGGMGFRYIESFNYAMLAKPFWRLMTNPESYAAKIMKEKYYKYGTILNAKLGGGPSLVCRSIWESKTLICEGMRWRVGNGKRIKILGDRWLPTPTSFEVQSPVKLLNKEATVDVLIDSSRGCWNYNLIKEVMNEIEAEIIRGLPLSKTGSMTK